MNQQHFRFFEKNVFFSESYQTAFQSIRKDFILMSNRDFSLRNKQLEEKEDPRLINISIFQLTASNMINIH